MQQIVTYAYNCMHIPVSILYKSIAGRYRSVRVADGPITALCRFIKNASWDVTCGQFRVKVSYDMYEPYTYVTLVHDYYKYFYLFVFVRSILSIIRYNNC